MPPSNANDKVCAVLTSDWHFSNAKPSRVTGDWFDSMRETLKSLRKLAIQYSCPLVVAGDLFHTWNEAPRVVNLVLTHLEGLTVVAVPGQHDLPYHDYSRRFDSAYGTLALSGAMNFIDLVHGEGKEIHHPACPVRFHGFPYGTPLESLAKPHDLLLEVAVVHAYVWSNAKTGYVGCPKESHVRSIRKRTRGYDVLVFGDNHLPFSHSFSGKNTNSRVLFNSGGLLWRTVDQNRSVSPVGLLKASGEVERVKIDTGNVEVSRDENVAEHFDWSRLKEEINRLVDQSVDFAEAVCRALDSEKVSDQVRRIVLESISEKSRDS